MSSPNKAGEDNSVRVEPGSNPNSELIRSDSAYPSVILHDPRFSSELHSEPSSELGDKWGNSSISNSQEQYYDHASCERETRITRLLSNTTEEDQNENRKDDNEMNGSKEIPKRSIGKRPSTFKRFSSIIEDDPNDNQEKTGNEMNESNKNSEEDTEGETNEITSLQNDDIVNEENDSSQNNKKNTNTIKSLEESYQQADESHYNVYDHLPTPSRGNEQVNRPHKSHSDSCIRKIVFVFSGLIALVSLVFGSQTRLFPGSDNAFLCENTQLYRQLSEFNSIGFIRYSIPSYQVTLSLSLEQLFNGYTTEYDLQINQRCPSCDGRGFVSSTCPVCRGRGVVDTVYGMGYCPQCHGHGYIHSKECHLCHGEGHIERKFTVNLEVQPGALDDSSNTYPLSAGDEVIFTIRQQPHSTFVRQGKDLYMQLSISMKEALLGTQKQIKMIDGELMTITIPTGIQHGEEIVVKNKGFIWDMNSKLKKTISHFITIRGNLYIKVNIEFPSSLSPEQRQVIESIF